MLSTMTGQGIWDAAKIAAFEGSSRVFGLESTGDEILVLVPVANAWMRTGNAIIGTGVGTSTGGSTTPKTVADGKITGYTGHGLNQAIGREGAGVKPGAILDAVKNPKQVIQQTGGRIKYVGQNATVVTNAEGKVITTWPHGSEGLRVPAGGN